MSSNKTPESVGYFVDSNKLGGTVVATLPVLFFYFCTFAAFSILTIFGESAKASVLSPLIFCIVVTATLTKAKREKVISNRALWYYAVSVKVLLSCFIYYFFWYEPLTKINMLRMDSQSYLGYQDSLFYDYIGALVSRLPFSDWPDYLNATWLSQGVIGYMGLVYWLFGVNQINYLFINLGFGFLSVLLVCWIVKEDFKGQAILVIFLPFVIYYEITPGKEVLTNFFTYGALYYLYAVFVSNFRYRNLFILLIFLILLGAVRLNGLFMVLVSFIAYMLLSNFNLKRIFVITLVSYVFAILLSKNETVEIIFSFKSHMDALALRLDASEASDAKIFAVNLLTSQIFILDMLLAPFRLIVWTLAPLPVNFLEVFYSVINSDGYLRFRNAEYAMRVASTLLILYGLIICFLNRRWNRLRGLAIGNSGYLLFFTLCFGLILSTTNFIEGARYRTLLGPMLLFSFLLISKAKHK